MFGSFSVPYKHVMDLHWGVVRHILNHHCRHYRGCDFRKPQSRQIVGVDYNIAALPLWLESSLYIFFGRSIKNARMISRRNRRRLKKLSPYRASDPDRMELSEESKQQIKLAHSLTGAQFFATNSSRIFTNGQDKFDFLEADLRTASKFIHLQYYIFGDDNTGRRIRDILIERARAG